MASVLRLYCLNHDINLTFVHPAKGAIILTETFVTGLSHKHCIRSLIQLDSSSDDLSSLVFVSSEVPKGVGSLLQTWTTADYRALKSELLWLPDRIAGVWRVLAEVWQNQLEWIKSDQLKNSF